MIEESRTCRDRLVLELERSKDSFVSVGEPLGPSDNPTWAMLGKRNLR